MNSQKGHHHDRWTQKMNRQWCSAVSVHTGTECDTFTFFFFFFFFTYATFIKSLHVSKMDGVMVW